MLQLQEVQVSGMMNLIDWIGRLDRWFSWNVLGAGLCKADVMVGEISRKDDSRSTLYTLAVGNCGLFAPRQDPRSLRQDNLNQADQTDTL